MSTNGLDKSMRATAPASEATLNEMFDFLACKLLAVATPREALVHLISLGVDTYCDVCAGNGDRRQRFTREFTRAHGLDENEILSWLAENYFEGNAESCDCLTLRLLASYVAGY
jgi:hypothetical protein